MARPSLRYFRLDEAKILALISEMVARIKERFPDAGLNAQAQLLKTIVEHDSRRAMQLQRPLVFFRCMMVLVACVLLAALGYGVWSLHPELRAPTLTELIQAADSGAQVLLMLGLALGWLFYAEGRRKQRQWRVLLRKLINLSHIIDMHQLNKDPDRLTRQLGENTESSPRLDKHVSTAFLMTRYLDYCRELLSIIGKMGAFYMQYTDDRIVIAEINQLIANEQSLRAGISSKIDSLAPLLIVEEQKKK